MMIKIMAFLASNQDSEEKAKQHVDKVITGITKEINHKFIAIVVVDMATIAMTIVRSTDCASSSTFVDRAARRSDSVSSSEVYKTSFLLVTLVCFVLTSDAFLVIFALPFSGSFLAG
ncbi:hypothetical protein Droror1_Dr00023608 [Drosera rotundifolia]